MSIASRARVMIADDHKLVAEALRRFLVVDFDVITTVNDGRSLVQAAEALRPDVIVVDIGLPLLNGLDAGERIKRVLPGVRLIFMTITREPEIIAEAFRRGASGYVAKTSAVTELVTAIHAALEGNTYLSPSLSSPDSAGSQPSTDNPTNEKLTERQLEVLQLLAEGRSMKETGAMLNLTARTVAFHKYRIMRCLRLHNDAAIVRYAVRRHIVCA